MSITTFNQFPYYDDFDETKNYMRILFRPGYSVQARELNQLQTAIQAQIDRFGSSIYKENARVLGGEINLDNKIPYVKVEASFGNFSVNGDSTNNVASYLSRNANGTYQIIGKILRGTARGASVNDLGNIRAEVVDIIPPVYESVGGNTVVKTPLTLQLRYLNSGGTPNSANDSLVNYFSPDEILIAEDNTFTFKVLPIDTEGAYPTGYGTRLFAEEAVYFVKGCFVHVPRRSINVATYSQTPYRRVVYNIIENIVTSSQDSSLNDNSIGTPNEGAPGANRYQIILDLGLDSFDPNKKLGKNVIEVAKIRAGKLVGKEVTQYSELGKVLARRTYEESGNYYLSPIPLVSNELLRNVSDPDPDYVGGIYTQTQIRDFYNTVTPESYGRSRLALSVGKGGNVAYVYGYRIEFLDSQIISTPKARETNTKNNASIDARVGNYLICSFDESSSSFEIDLSYEPLEIYNSSNEMIGTARVRNIEYHTSSQVKLFLSNVTQEFDTDGLPIDSLSNMAYLTSTQTEDDFVLNIDESTFVDENYHSYIFKNPCSVTKSVGDISYVIRDSLLSSSSNATVTDDKIVLSVKNASYDEFQYTGINSFLVVDTDNGGIVEFESVTLNATNKTATITFDTTTSIPSNFIVYFNIKRTEAANTTALRRTKTLKTDSDVISNPNRQGGGNDPLRRYDIKRLIGVFTVPAGTNRTPSENDINITDNYILDNGQRENYYGYGAIRLRCGCDGPPDGSQIRVFYEYYEWSEGGEYFTADSYYSVENVLTAQEGFNYETIPTFYSNKYGEINLRDVVDFRPRITDIESQTAITLARLPRIIGDFTFYLPRIDKLYLNKDGELGISRGVSSENPTPADVPNEVMVLYTLRMNPYTFNPNDFVKTVHNHRRYTMRDIGKLDNRITKLEKFTQLNVLEEETRSEQILDENGDDRFKNGFLADPCGGHILGYTKSFEYGVSINLENPSFYPVTNNNDIRFVLDNERTSSEYRTIGSKLLLPFAEVKYVGSPYATKPVEVIITPPPQPDQVYSLVADKTEVVDGQTVNFSVSADNVENGTKIFWVIDRSDVFDTANLFGELTINNELATFSLDVDLSEAITENQRVRITLRADSNGRPEGYNSSSISSTFSNGSKYDLILSPISVVVTPAATNPEPSYKVRPIGNTFLIEPPSTSISRKSYVDVRINTSNVANGTILYWDIQDTTNRGSVPSGIFGGVITESDFTDDEGLSGSVTINDNVATFRKSIAGSDGREIQERFVVNFRLKPNDFNDRTNPPVAKTGQIIIIDNEQPPSTVLPPIPTSKIEGVVDLSPQSDNTYSYDTRPIVLFDDELQGIFDNIKNNPDDNDEFLSKYIWEGDIYHWIGKNYFNIDESNPDINQNFPSFLGTDRGFRTKFYDYGISNSKVSDMRFRSEEISLRMRSRKIYFKASGLKPNTRYFPKFGGFDISEYTIKENYKAYLSRTDKDKLYTGLTRHPDLTSTNQRLITDSKGYVSGSFIIPNNPQRSFSTNVEFSFRLDEDPSNTNNRSFASTNYIATGDKNLTQKVVYVYLLDDQNKGPIDTDGLSWREYLNQTEIEGSEALNIPESLALENLSNLSSMVYTAEFYQEEITVSDAPSGNVEVARNLTLVGTEAVPQSTLESYLNALEQQVNIVYNYSYTSNNVSGLYITEISSEIDVLEFISDPLYLEKLNAGRYTIRYVRLITNSETENNVNPNSDSADFATENQFDIQQTLNSQYGNKRVGPTDSVI